MKLYQQIEHYIYEKIQNGELKVGDQIPTETELAQLFSASRPTVRQALTHLSLGGYLMRVKGKGSFITQPKVLHESTSFLSGYRQEVGRRNQTLITHVVSQTLVRANEKIAGQLKIATGTKVICLSRVRIVDQFNNNLPVVYTTLYVPYQKLPKMLETDFTAISFYDFLYDNGLPVKHASKRLEVCMPPPEAAAQLQIGSFEPVVFIASQGTTEQGTVIEYSESYYPAGCSQFLIEINN